ncbi:ABC transporter G family member 23-like [Adelges cooleyi]|uniref:ABC transporter G family member 23-like n=1 Tax=Adelges cooleyi TaxID=133065 RepID=UPI00217FFB90|nr:ABC transporter G family member 23-like [Adelges cooleyi]
MFSILEQKNDKKWPKYQQAVCVRHAFKYYGPTRKPNHVLSSLHMTVAKGTVYGLLGASGCGKTTLLSCIVGRRRLDKGHVYVLGGKPGKKGSGVPGKRVGYMPQEIALYGEFSIRETMMYFGWIFGMETAKIIDRARFLLELLELPGQSSLVKNLSGGQQRRVSFAVALMHDPELLILDEPTVGVDPLLRHSIWNHLVHITTETGTTVIITTHYIEEARQAHKIGLMRNGRLLAEESPAVLLTRYDCQSLEEVFLKLSRKQRSDDTTADTSNNISLATTKTSDLAKASKTAEEETDSPEPPDSVATEDVVISIQPNSDGGTAAQVLKIKPEERRRDSCCCGITSWGKTKALLQKNFLRIWRNVGMMLFMFALPVIEVVLFCWAIGRDPKDLHLAVANSEMDWRTKECPVYTNCTQSKLSCKYLDALPKDTLILDYYENVGAALDAVRRGHTWGAVHFAADFSDSLFARTHLGGTADNATMEHGEVQVWLDMSNQQIGLMLVRYLQTAYGDFKRDLLVRCGRNPKLGDLPVTFNEPVYGNSNPTFENFVAPGVILTIVFFLAVAHTTSSLITEQTEGLLDRSWVAGVTTTELLFSHVITQLLIICGQAALTLVFMLVVFRVECKGRTGLVIVLTLMQGLCGMCYGFVVSAVCDRERDANQLAMGSFYPMLLLSGVIWPVEGMPKVLWYVSYCLPLTTATTSLRSILSRGWGLLDDGVYLGFVSTALWILLFLSLSMAIFKYKNG